MRINEIFYSIQGESTYAGLPCVMVRTTGCPLRCVWCDTPYAFYEGREWALDEILAEVRKYPCRLVELTGGEPLVQREAGPLVRLLLDRGYTVLIETSGGVPIRDIDLRAIVILDLKCPGSGENESICWENLAALRPHDQIKFVVADRADFDWAVATTRMHRLAECHAVLFSPVFGKLDPRDLAGWLLATGLPARLQLQIHKHIWDPETRGV